MADASASFSTLENRVRSLPKDERTWCLGTDQRTTQQGEPKKKGRNLTPSYIIVDSQSTKTNYEGEAIGFHGGKKVKGRSRQIAVDTQGNIWSAHVHAANTADTKGGCDIIDKVFKELSDVQAICADAGYRGTFVDHVKKEWDTVVHISEKIKDGFAIIPKRWVVERTFSWLNGKRGLSKDYEKTTSSSESQILIANISRNLRQF